MAKKKKRQTQKSNQLKSTLKYELSGLILIALAVIAMAQLGAAGKAVVLFFRFFMGEWYMLSLIGLIIFSFYIMWKRQLPFLFQVKLFGTYLIIGAILLLSHVTLFEHLSNGGQFENPSVIMNTWDLYMMEIRGETSTVDLGGGMIGAVLFATFYYLFDAVGSQLIAFVSIIIGFILITGRTFGETAGKVIQSIGNFIGRQWQGFIEDLKTWQQDFLRKKAERLEAKKEQTPKESSKPTTRSKNKTVSVAVED